MRNLLILMFLILSACGGGSPSSNSGFVASAFAQTPDPGWTNVPFDSTNFYAPGQMTWTVDEADAVTFAYTINNNVMTVFFYLYPTSVGGVMINNLRMRVPAGKHIAATAFNPVVIIENGVKSIGYAGVTKEHGVPPAIYISKIGEDNFNPSIDRTAIFGQITFPILP